MQTLAARSHPVSEQISELRENCPHSIALSYGDRELSYEELDRRANRFAGHLMQFGIVTGDTVAMCIERSFDWIVAPLGIMRAGAAYVSRLAGVAFAFCRGRLGCYRSRRQSGAS